MSTGANKPLLVTAVDEVTGKRKDCVVKLMGAERMSKEASAREVIAGFMAIELGISVVFPVLVRITPEFVEVLKGKENFLTAQNSIGLNYGSFYLGNYQTIPSTMKLNPKQEDQAKIIFMFDMLIQNSDRTFDKPNCMANNEEIVIYDHELAFGFVLDLVSNPNPWEFRESDQEWIQKQFLYKKLKGKQIEKKIVMKNLEKINEAFWNKAFALLPGEWRTDQLEKIRSTINQIVLNSEKFAENLNRILA